MKDLPYWSTSFPIPYSQNTAARDLRCVLTAPLEAHRRCGNFALLTTSSAPKKKGESCLALGWGCTPDDWKCPTETCHFRSWAHSQQCCDIMASSWVSMGHFLSSCVQPWSFDLAKQLSPFPEMKKWQGGQSSSSGDELQEPVNTHLKSLETMF